MIRDIPAAAAGRRSMMIQTQLRNTQAKTKAALETTSSSVVTKIPNAARCSSARKTIPAARRTLPVDAAVTRAEDMLSCWICTEQASPLVSAQSRGLRGRIPDNYSVTGQTAQGGVTGPASAATPCRHGVRCRRDDCADNAEANT